MILTIPSKNTIIFCSIVLVSLLLRLFFIGHHDLLAEEAYYWNYAMHLDWGYLDHPLMVALLIKLSTTLFGLTEFGVRFPALACWGITLYYSFKWSERIHRGCGLYAMLLLSILPFFFLYSLIITPDLPLIACWSAALYYLYRALCGNEKRAWYYAGVAIGLGLLSKYTMVLLMATTGVYVLLVPTARIWLRRKEPYFALGIIGLLFTPVIYWNITHDWASFAFQSTRRFNGDFHFSLHELVGLFGCFLTPVGMIGFYKLIRHKAQQVLLPITTIRMFQYFTCIPLSVFLVFSITRDIKCNWIGPSLLGIIPWLALLMHHHAHTVQRWYLTGGLLLVGYAGLLYCITFGQPMLINQSLFNKMISWRALTAEIYSLATKVALTQHEQPLIIPLDSYSIASELTFYQAKLLQDSSTQHLIFPIYGAEPLGYNSLMFQYWYPYPDLQNKLVILIGKTPDALRSQRYITPTSEIQKIWGVSQGQLAPVREYYYQVARMSFTAASADAF
jgi:dolichol-phosphate mannosyltransferase